MVVARDQELVLLGGCINHRNIAAICGVVGRCLARDGGRKRCGRDARSVHVVAIATVRLIVWRSLILLNAPYQEICSGLKTETLCDVDRVWILQFAHFDYRYPHIDHRDTVSQ